MATAKKNKVLPGFSQGVRTSASARMLTMARPICPQSKITLRKNSMGDLEPVLPPGDPNCQLEGGRWWEQCEARGHDPYHTTRKWYTTEDIIEPDEQGRLVKKGEALIPHETTVLNTAQVAAQVNINNGRGPREAIDLKGFRTLTQMGYDEVCQFRNCQKPVSDEGTSRKYGRYCSKEHMALIGVVVEEMVMPVADARLSGWDSTKAAKARERVMREATAGA